MEDRKDKAAIRLAREIVRFMYENDMSKGDRYLSEAEGIRQHGVARNTMREALRFLELQGVLEVRAGPGGGAMVDQPGWPHLASTIALLLQFAKAPLRSVIEGRGVIEPGVVALAAINATEDEIAAMAEDLDLIQRDIGNYDRFSDHYHRFWRRLAESTHNQLLAFLCPALRAIVDSGKFVPNEVYREQLLGTLRNIHGAIAARDADRARALMEAHEAERLDRLMRGYPRQMERVVAWSDLDDEYGAS